MQSNILSVAYVSSNTKTTYLPLFQMYVMWVGPYGAINLDCNADQIYLDPAIGGLDTLNNDFVLDYALACLKSQICFERKCWSY